METGTSESAKFQEKGASQATIQKVVDTIGAIAQKGMAYDDEGCFERNEPLDPEKFDGFIDYSVERLTLPEERKNPDEPIALAAFTTTKEGEQIIIGYEVSREGPVMRIDRNDTSSKQHLTEEDLTRLLYENNSRNGRKESGESLVGELEATTLLSLLQKINEHVKHKNVRKPVLDDLAMRRAKRAAGEKGS